MKSYEFMNFTLKAQTTKLCQDIDLIGYVCRCKQLNGMVEMVKTERQW